MNAKEYRKQLLAALAASGASAELSAASASLSHEAEWKAALASLLDVSSSDEERKDALARLQAGTFLGHQFDPVRAEYTDALRRCATDPNEEIRSYALGILIDEKDDFARRKLVEGLQGKAEALLPPAAALALLASDEHNSASAIAADFLSKSTDPAVRMQAVRVLGRNPDASEELEKIVRNKDEFREVRRAGAVALKNLNPDLFLQSAAAIMNDKEDFPDIKSSIGGALERAGVALNRIQSGS